MAEAVVEYLAPVRERYDELRADEAALEGILAAGAEKARAIAARDARRRARARWASARPSVGPPLAFPVADAASPTSSSTSTSSPGPFDLLLTLVLREEVDLLEVELADVVLAYLDHLEARGELDLEAATEFLVLIAALLELKSRLMLPRRGARSCSTSSPPRRPRSCWRGCSSARRYRARRRRAARAAGGRGGRALPLRAAAARAAARVAGRRRGGLRARRGSARRSAALLRDAAADRPRATWRSPRSRWPSGCSTCARCCAAARFASTRRCEGADRVTVAVTLFALLELYKRGEATGSRPSRSGDHGGAARRRRERRRRPRERAGTDRRGAAVPVARAGRASPSSPRRATPAPTEVVGARSPSCATRCDGPRRRRCARSPAAGRSPPTRSPRRPRGACSPSRARRR